MMKFSPTYFSHFYGSYFIQMNNQTLASNRLHTLK